MDTAAIYLFFFGMLALVAFGLLVPAHYITMPKDDELKGKQGE